MSEVERHRWSVSGPLNVVSRPRSKWRYVLEAVTPDGRLEWCGAFQTRQAAWRVRLRLRQDWQYRVFDTYSQNLAEL